MKSGVSCIVTSVLSTLGILVLLAAAFDLFPAQDNLLVFIGIACFIVTGTINRMIRKNCCR